jgi:hypothetical protein
MLVYSFGVKVSAVGEEAVEAVEEQRIVDNNNNNNNK